ncbi:MAG: hypothetical protein ACRD1X_05645, partial [Vicinamibacteria bacterium]
MRTQTFLGFATALFAALVPSWVQATTIEFVTPVQSLSLGDAASVDIFVSGLGNGTALSLGAFDLDVAFDPAILVPVSVTFASFLGDPLDPLETLT